MTPRWFGTAFLCVGAVAAVLGLIFALQSTASGGPWVYLVLAFGGLVLMVSGYFIGKRKSWN